MTASQKKVHRLQNN